MRFLRFELRNYAGIVNGMGLETITIDFTRCKNIITLICGKNGVGKSTLLKAMNPLPDTSDCFLDGKPAHKCMTIQDDGAIYDIKILSDVNGNMVRQPNKAYITKNGIELNPTGNIGSYKDIIFNEFELDANYITLSKLSNEDRGLAMRTPAERKRFIANILSTIEVYNAINKDLTKKVNIFKSYINNLDSKIKNIGDPIHIKTTADEIEVKYKTKTTEKEGLIAEKSKAVGFISSVDPDGKIQEEYQKIYDQIKIINYDIEQLKLKIPNGILTDDEYTNTLDVINKLSYNLEKAKANQSVILTSKSELETNLDIDEQKLANTEIGLESSNLSSAVEVMGNKINALEEEFKHLQIPYETISRDEFVLIYDILHSTRENLSNLFSYYSDIEISTAVQSIIEQKDLDSIIRDISNANESLVEELSRKTLEIDSIDKKLERLSSLNARPKGCKIDNCPFIKDLVEIKKSEKEYIKQRQKIEKDIADINAKRKANKEMLENSRSISSVVKDIMTILNPLSTNSKLIKKFKTVSFFANRNDVLKRISNMNNFSEIDELLKYVDLFNDAETLKNMKTKMITLEADLKVAKAKEDAVTSLQTSIDNARKKINDYSTKLTDLNNEIETCTESLSYHQAKVAAYEEAKELKNKISSLEKDKSDLKRQYEQIKGNISQIKIYVDKINLIDSNIHNLEQELSVMEKEKDEINYALTNLNTYTRELNQYKEKYNYVNTLKKYSSPTTGIQTIYMDMYMGKTLSMANELLGMMFEGEYQLLPYVVNETEFRIPFIGNNFPVDDISNGSTSQLCIIGTIMNLVLLYQASSKYNIVSLDEIDGGLDNHNRYDFIPTLYKLIDILKINQLLMISHNVEADLSNVDIIKLKGYDNDSNDNSNVNIIYDYRNEKG